MIFSSSVCTGEQTHVKPGRLNELAMISAITLSWEMDDGKYPKNLGCCQWVMVGINNSSVSFRISSNSLPWIGGDSGIWDLRKPGWTDGETLMSSKFS